MSGDHLKRFGQRSRAGLVARSIVLFAINRYAPVRFVHGRVAKIELLAAKRQEQFALFTVSQILHIDHECLAIQPRSLGGWDFARVGVKQPWGAFAVAPIKPDRYFIGASGLVTLVGLAFLATGRQCGHNTVAGG